MKERNLSIFLADDDNDDQELIIEAIAKLNPTVTFIVFNSGKELVEHLDRLHDSLLPDVILLDFNMPQLNGYEVLQLLEGDNRLRHIRKIVWSTADSPEYKEQCLGAGACQYIVKPYGEQELNRLAAVLIDSNYSPMRLKPV